MSSISSNVYVNHQYMYDVHHLLAPQDKRVAK